LYPLLVLVLASAQASRVLSHPPLCQEAWRAECDARVAGRAQMCPRALSPSVRGERNPVRVSAGNSRPGQR
jgi:hypothetical protein